MWQTRLGPTYSELPHTIILLNIFLYLIGLINYSNMAMFERKHPPLISRSAFLMLTCAIIGQLWSNYQKMINNLEVEMVYCNSM